MISTTFLRYELKYLLTEAQYAAVRAETDNRLSPDAFGETTVQSLYFDTPDFRLIRASIEEPEYKEKLRLRCYGQNTDDRDVYLEMKRKADGVVYKRRLACKEAEGKALSDASLADSQIGRELRYFLRLYGNLAPRCLILCERSAFFDPQSDLRVTFDRNVRFRTDRLDCSETTEGQSLLPPGTVLMELKTGTAFPLWLCRLLSRNRFYKTSFSKYGTAYLRNFQNII